MLVECDRIQSDQELEKRDRFGTYAGDIEKSIGTPAVGEKLAQIGDRLDAFKSQGLDQRFKSERLLSRGHVQHFGRANFRYGSLKTGQVMGVRISEDEALHSGSNETLVINGSLKHRISELGPKMLRISTGPAPVRKCSPRIQ